MSYEERIRQERSHMSKSFAKLADFLLDSYVEAAFMTASELAHTLNLDAATVVRFSQHLGYSGFPKLQREIRARVKHDLLIRPQEVEIDKSVPGIASIALHDVAVALDRTRISLDTDALEKLVDQMGKARRIVVLAEGPAQPTAYSLVLFLEQGGLPGLYRKSGCSRPGSYRKHRYGSRSSPGHGSRRTSAIHSPSIGRSPGKRNIYGCHHWLSVTRFRTLCRYSFSCTVPSFHWCTHSCG